MYDYKDPNGTNFKDKYEQDFKVLITGDISVELITLNQFSNPTPRITINGPFNVKPSLTI